MLRRAILLVATMVLTVLVASGVALAVTKIGTDGPDTLRGTNGNDKLIGKGAMTYSSPCVATTTSLVVRVKILFSAVTSGVPWVATRTWTVVPATM
jgi:hypothetical protein